MPKNLLIVESPAKAKTINKYLGKDFQVLASYGHVRDLVPKEGAVDPDAGFAMRYEVIEKQARYLRNATGFREGLPNVHRVAAAWLEELQNGDPSPEEVAAFETYMATAKVAFMNQSVVGDAAAARC